ncbi:CARDB domain-containing protein [Pyrococcus yayanosii]|uniref:CARDB domain-containing protein n=1 Tax=Pyrococcus yayanosii (strain CH1 / JCM 16557) TaxID=529709 RepID=F8AHV7_PYRYC|nr:CARDB domain-containing protein [Pyrococcus yayanosii]AEH24244.1 hypothetical protein PYCH_05560 [Pyrococcus yayanosii CH1]
MKKGAGLLVVLLLFLSLVPMTDVVSAMYGTKIIDGDLSDWTPSDIVAVGVDNGQAGANLDRLYVAWDDQYLYIAIKTNNTESWGIVYGIGIDVDPGTGSGYTFYDQDGNPSTTEDMWWRNIAFGSGYAIDYEIYFWYDAENDRIGGGSFGTWTGSGWETTDVNNVLQYAQTSGSGLQVLEMAIPWSALGGKPNKIAIISWISGGNGGDSAVDTLPIDPAIDYNNIGSEWTDGDTLTNLAELYVGTKTIDGDLSDWTPNERISSADSGLAGAEIKALYVSWDSEYLYIAIETGNTQSWDVAYGVGIDVDPGTGSGYTGGDNPSDAWGRKIGFGNGYAVDYEIYFWWGWNTGMGADNFIRWTGNGWDYKSLAEIGATFAYTGDTSTGLQTLEIAIPWSALGGKQSSFAIITWVAGGDGSSAVDSAPVDTGIDYTNINGEWTDSDIFTNLATFEWFLMPDLTVTVSGPAAVGVGKEAEFTVRVKNEGSLPVTGASVKLYINEELHAEWRVDLGPGEETSLTTIWTPEVEGTYTLRAIVDEDNLIAEANENNNEFVMTVNVVWVGTVNVDGDPGDWPTITVEPNSYTLKDGVFFWNDSVGDQRHSKDLYLPGETSSHADLVGVGVTKDDRYVYFLFRFADMSNIKIGDNGATFIAVPIDYKEGGADWFAGEMDTKTVILWDIQMVVNLGGTEYSGQVQAIAPAGESKTSLLYFVDAKGDIIPVEDALIGVDLTKNTVEVRIPLSIFEGAKEFSFQVATAFSYGPAVWNFGDPFANDEKTDIVDTISTEDTVQELADNVPHFYVKIKMNSIVEYAEVVDYRVIEELMRQKQEEMRRIQYMNAFVNVAKFYGIRSFQRDYARYRELVEMLSSKPLPDEVRGKLREYEFEVQELLNLYNYGKERIEKNYLAFGAALKIYRAYIRLRSIVRDLEEIMNMIESGELEWQKEMERLRQNLTKEIDGDISDWKVKPVVEDTTGFGQDGANLKALYVDYDENFLYIALTTENKASWRVAYGISLDFKEGGYTAGQDAWSRSISFDRGIDAQLYFFWNGEFFGDPGTSTITSAQLALWNGTAWVYNDLDSVAFYAYTGGSENGLQVIEIAIPWKVLGGKPTEIYIVAYVTGQGAGDSAVDALPDQSALHDNEPGNEWTDEDFFTEFARVVIR